MEIYIPKPSREIVASKAGVILDGSLTSMAGTDCTEPLQKIIDQYTPECNLKLIIDGVALVHELKLRSNLHIQGCGPHTGFSQNYSDDPLPCAIRNANWRSTWNTPEIEDHDIWVSDLTINGNRDNGLSRNPGDKRFSKSGAHFIPARFYGIRSFQFRNIRVIDMAVYAVSAANLEWFAFDNCDLIHTEFMKGNLYPDFGRGQNTDGIHINGPASDGTITNIRLATGDDGIALNATDGGRNPWDEATKEAHKEAFATQYWMGPIKRVAISNITSHNSWQIIRLLSGRDETYGTGMVAEIDDVTITNVSGVCANYAIGMEKWPDGGTPVFGKISISHVNVEHRSDGYVHDPILWNPYGKPNTPWINWYFIGIGGDCSQIMISDIKRNSIDALNNAIHVHNGTRVKDLVISDLSVCEGGSVIPSSQGRHEFPSSQGSPSRNNPGPLIKIGGRFYQGFDGKTFVRLDDVLFYRFDQFVFGLVKHSFLLRPCAVFLPMQIVSLFPWGVLRWVRNAFGSGMLQFSRTEKRHNMPQIHNLQRIKSSKCTI